MVYQVNYAIAIASRAAGIARGLAQRKWSQSASSQIWSLVPSVRSNNLVDLSSIDDIYELDDEGDNSQLLSHSSTEQRIKKNRPNLGITDGNHTSSINHKLGGFLKLTRPKVLNLW